MKILDRLPVFDKHDESEFRGEPVLGISEAVSPTCWP
jgi:hypothetical protein